MSSHESEVNGNATVWVQPGGHEPGVESIVGEGYSHEMKDRIARAAQPHSRRNKSPSIRD